MFKFKGFKASLNFNSILKKTDTEVTGAEVSIIGSYRTHKDEYFENGNLQDPPKKPTPSMVTLPASSPPVPIRQIKSTNNLAIPNTTVNPRKSNEVSTDPRGAPTNVRSSNTPIKPQRRPKSLDNDRESKKLEKKKILDQKNQEKERQKLEKQKLEEQKKKDKIAAQEQAKLVKMKKERDRKAEQGQIKRKRDRKPAKPVPVPQEPSKPVERMNPLAQVPGQQPYSTNTLDSSISKSSGPPPYTETATVVPNEQDNTGNTSFVKKVEEKSSWDLISKHREEIKRPAHQPRQKRKQIVMDLNYKLNEQSNDNHGNNQSDELK